MAPKVIFKFINYCLQIGKGYGLAPLGIDQKLPHTSPCGLNNILYQSCPEARSPICSFSDPYHDSAVQSRHKKRSKPFGLDAQTLESAEPIRRRAKMSILYSYP